MNYGDFKVINNFEIPIIHFSNFFRNENENFPNKKNKLSFYQKLETLFFLSGNFQTKKNVVFFSFCIKINYAKRILLFLIFILYIINIKFFFFIVF